MKGISAIGKKAQSSCALLLFPSSINDIVFQLWRLNNACIYRLHCTLLWTPSLICFVELLLPHVSLFLNSLKQTLSLLLHGFSKLTLLVLSPLPFSPLLAGSRFQNRRSSPSPMRSKQQKKIESGFALRGRKCALWKSIPDSYRVWKDAYRVIDFWVFDTLVHLVIAESQSLTAFTYTKPRMHCLEASWQLIKPSRTFFFLYKTRLRLRLHLSPHGPSYL